MVDIQIAIFIMVFICSMLFLLSYFAYNNLGKTGKAVFSIGVIGLILLHVFVLADSTWWAKILPVKAIIVYSNLLIPLCGVLSGIIWANKWLHKFRGILAIILLFFLAFIPTTRQIPLKQAQFHNIWNDDICIQTNQTSCAPAAATTLLKHFGIETNEQEMAKLSLTRPDGTSLFGLFRALKIKTQDSQYQILLGKADLEQLRKDTPLPVILIVCLDEKTNKNDPRYSEKWGWGVGITHTVVLFKFIDNDKIEIGDPSIGRETWNTKALEDLWHGEFITITRVVD